MFRSSWKFAALAGAGLVIGAATAGHAATLTGPVSYLSAADIPANFYAGGSPLFLEDFEDGSLDGGITASAGAPYGPAGNADSVDGDDGTIDGFGTAGRSFFYAGGSAGITFTFAAPVTAAAVVWTDGAGTTYFEAFDTNGVSLGSIGPVALADGTYSGTTSEDSFFGVQSADGIGSIFISNSLGGIEVDHVQYGDMYMGNPVPLPATLPLLAGAFAVAGATLRRRQRN
ncbi:hypothetical protein RGUI_2100 [Rhodovulum sp. P5]|uniref:hypothetical protein n=1 Tax=Rhodovulum sp. P5 TaxID=1564506 RepID=UPI0009C3A4F9|nr:hypothetical protein [Rhodovulum sp. P5]ARE40241.1 hypothetical protein RGUI_2100 [Rhodovulum sp. P5]